MGKWMVGANASNVQYQAGSRSAFRDTAIFNTAGLISSYQLTPQWFLSAGYSDTFASHANGIADRARYRQLSFEQNYALSKRTAIYLIEARQLARGQTLGQDGRHSSTPSPRRRFAKRHAVVERRADGGDGRSQAFFLKRLLNSRGFN